MIESDLQLVDGVAPSCQYCRWEDETDRRRRTSANAGQDSSSATKLVQPIPKPVSEQSPPPDAASPSRLKIALVVASALGVPALTAAWLGWPAGLACLGCIAVAAAVQPALWNIVRPYQGPKIAY